MTRDEKRAPKRPVLVVDDERENVEFVVRALRRKFDLGVAHSGEEAVKLLEAREFACVMSDQRMPGMQGSELLGVAARLQPQSIRILMTGYSDEQSIVDAINVGHVVSFLKKPFGADEVLATLEGAIRYHDVLVQNSSLVRELEKKNAELERHERMLAQSLDERTAELAALVAKLEAMVIRDPLTGLYNHRYFQERLAQEVSRALRHQLQLSLLFIDVDHFKNYNDRNGHPAGDEALRRVATVLASTVRASDLVVLLRESDLVARYGGEEFVVMLPETSVTGARVAAQRIMGRIAKADIPHGEFQPGGRFSISIGLASLPEHAKTKEAIIICADTALYAAKRAGRDRMAVYDPAAEPDADLA